VQETALAQTRLMLPPLEKQLAPQRNLLAVLTGGFTSERMAATFKLTSFRLPRKLPLTLTADDLRANYPAQTLDVTYLSGEGSISASFTGVSLWQILSAAQPNLNADVKNDRLSLFVVVTGSDGYQAVIAWGEIDPEFGNQPVLVAYEQDGAPISDASGTLRLVVPGDAHGGRYVSGVVNISLRDAPAVSR